MGLKALAIYRDNCKVGQPLSDATGKASSDSAVKNVSGEGDELSHPIRKRLPKSRPSSTTSFTVGGSEGYMIAGSYPDGGLGEVFLKLGKQGSTLAGVMDAFSIAVSIGLQYGVPLETFVQKFTNVSFEPAGLTDDRDIRIAKSLMDYIFRRLALDYLPAETRLAMGIQTADERTADLDSNAAYSEASSTAMAATPVESSQSEQIAHPQPNESSQAHDHSSDHMHEHHHQQTEFDLDDGDILAAQGHSVANDHSAFELFEILQNLDVDAPLCFSCGIKMRRSGSCHVCEGCGSTSGCS